MAFIFIFPTHSGTVQLENNIENLCAEFLLVSHYIGVSFSFTILHINLPHTPPHLISGSEMNCSSLLSLLFCLGLLTPDAEE